MNLLLRTTPDSLAQSSFKNEIHCYSLPYGALGFTSHILTYYTILCLWFGRKPLWPFSRVRYSQLDLVLGIVGLGVTIAVSIVTILRCRNTWQLLVIAVWKLDVSLMNGVTAVHVAILMRRRLGGWSGEVVESVEVGRPISSFDGKDEKETVGVTPVQSTPSSGSGEQQEPIHALPLKSASWWILLCSSHSPSSFSLTSFPCRHPRNVRRHNRPHVPNPQVWPRAPGHT